MKIAIIAPSPVPFTFGGAEFLIHGMYTSINSKTQNQCELIKYPVREDNFWNLVDSYHFYYNLDLSHFDLVISTKYPSWMVQHKNHYVYLIHHLRGLFDTYHFCNEPETIPEHLNTDILHEILTITSRKIVSARNVDEVFEKLDLLKSNQESYDNETFKFPGPFIREIIHFLDRFALSPDRIKKYYTMSENVRQRKNYFPDNVPVKVIYPPSSIKQFQCNEYQDLITASRLDNPKRIDLMIQAMKFVPHKINFKIVGEGPEENRLKKLAGSDQRIEFLGYVSESRIGELYSGALAVLFAPYDEDYGLITIEAMMSRKPVITTTDSGGPCEFVTDGETGFVIPPDPEKFAEKINFFIENRNEAIRMGNLGHNRVKNITWENFIIDLLGDDQIIERKKKKILVLSTYSCFPPRGGGQHRLYHLYTRLSKVFDVTICSIIESNKEYRDVTLENGLKQICIPQSMEHAQVQWSLEKKIGKNLYDISMIDNVEKSDSYIQVVKNLIADSEIIIFSHPYLFSLEKFVTKNQKKIFDAIDSEYFQKKKYISDEDLISKIFSIEQQACCSSDLIWVTSIEDKKNLVSLYNISEGKIIVISNGTDTTDIQYIEDSEKEHSKQLVGLSSSQTVLFVGSWHPPNLEALQFIIDKLAKQFDLVKFLIIGSIKDFYLQKKNSFPHNVLAFGVVDEVEKYEIYKLADIALNPMLSGSGTNLKMLDYMSAGIPIISTPIGARGLDITHNVDSIICEPEQFADECKELLNNDSKQEILRKNARKIVEEKYSWKWIAGIAEDSINKLG